MSELSHDQVLNLATVFKDVVTGCGILIGGIWAYFRFSLGRGRETALSLDLSYSTSEYDKEKWFTFIDVSLTNKGQVQLRARETVPAYEHRYGPQYRHKYGFGLKIRKIPPGLETDDWVDWFDERIEWAETLPEANLLKGYVKRGAQGLQTDFWMEPGESYCFAAPFILSPGSYLALVTFVGASERTDEFWQRIFYLQIPARDNTPERLPTASPDLPC